MKRITFQTIQEQALQRSEDIITCCSMQMQPVVEYPINQDFTMIAICTSGSMTLDIDFNSYDVKAPAVATVIPNKRVEFKSVSSDYTAYYVFISQRFAQNILDNIGDKVSMILSLYSNPIATIDPRDLPSYILLHESITRALNMSDHPNRTEIVKHLILAFHYAFSHSYQNQQNQFSMPQEKMVSDFFRLAHQNYKQERRIGFYANKLGISAKYLSKIIRDASGRSAKEWLDELTLSEAKRLLRSTGQTILQISDELNFPSQSFFGKYFKSHMGVSPRKFRGY